MFNTDIMKQFDMSRGTLIKSIQLFVLIATNRSFTIAGLTSDLSPNYIQLFKAGTSPKDWTHGIPSLKDLFEKLDQQKILVRETFSCCMDEKLGTPFKINGYGGHELLSIGEMLNFFIFHEAMHLGYIDALKRIISTNQ